MLVYLRGCCDCLMLYEDDSDLVGLGVDVGLV